MSRGRFFTFEGIEGCGKTTQSRRLADHFEAGGAGVLRTREPGGSDLGRALRRLLLDPCRDAMDPRAELLLYCADRAEHVARVIRPALEAGCTVVCDRFSDATRAYQGVARGLGVDLVNQLNVGHLDPDLTLLIDVPVEVGVARARRRDDDTGMGHESRFEQEAMAFHAAVRDAYLALAAADPRRIRIIDGRGDPDTVFASVRAAVTVAGVGP